VIALEKKYLDQIYKINPSVEDIENGIMRTLSNGSISSISDMSQTKSKSHKEGGTVKYGGKAITAK
jgi:hypothetical protein